MKLAASIALLLVACAGPPSAFPPSGARSPLNVEIEMPLALEATTLARAEWAKRLGVALPAKLPRVRWFEGDPLTYKGLTHKAHSQYTVQGNEVQVTATPGGARATHPSGTDLAHEMLHWALYQSRGDGDRPHALPIWQQERDVRAALREAGL